MYYIYQVVNTVNGKIKYICIPCKHIETSRKRINSCYDCMYEKELYTICNNKDTSNKILSELKNK